MKTPKPLATRQTDKTTRPKKKRSLDNSSLLPFFGKSPERIWDKDIYTGEENVDF